MAEVDDGMKNKMFNKIFIGLVISFLFSSSTIVSLASANLIVDPAKLGILRLQLYPLSPAVAIREFRVGNTYDVPMDIELEATDDMVSLITLAETKFTLQPNENRTIEYTVTINEPGYYSGGILVKANLANGGTFGYNAGLAVFVNKGNLEPYFYFAIGLAVAAVVLAFTFFLMRKTRRKRGKK